MTLTVSAGTTPELQPWLGMLGHLIIVGPIPVSAQVGTAAQNAPTWAHAHSMGDLSPKPHAHHGTGSGMAGTDGMDGMEGMDLMSGNGDGVGDETVSGYGPTISFTYTFAFPGRYRAWIQVEREYRILTVPVLLDVAKASAW